MKLKLSLLLFIISLLFSCSNDDNESIILPEELDFIGPTLGCGDFSIAQFLNEDNLNISLNINSINFNGRESLNLTNESQIFSLPNNDLDVGISVWNIPVNLDFCNDIAPLITPILINSWTAISGNLEISISNFDNVNMFYDVTILLEDILFENDNGDQRFISNLILEEVTVGLFAG